MPGGSRAGRTPIGARGWDTPANVGDEYDDLDGEYGELAGPSRPRKKRKPQPTGPKVRDDLTLDNFQRNYTSEDNASFVQIVKEDNTRRREERWGWAWEAEKKAEQRKLEGEERRKMILDAATSGQWRVDANGRRLIGGLAEGGSDRAEGEAWKNERRLLTGGAVPGRGVAGPSGASGQGLLENSTSALVPHSSSNMSNALILAKDAKIPLDKVVEQALPDEHPLNKALVAAGLPGTALVSVEDGMIVPHRDVAEGEGDGRGRGQEDRETRMAIERAILGDERPDYLSLAGSGGDHWTFKVRLTQSGQASERC